MIFGYVIDPKSDLTIEWCEAERPVFRELSEEIVHADDLLAFDNLAYDDLLYQNSSRDFWQWLIPLATFHVALDSEALFGQVVVAGVPNHRRDDIDCIKKLQERYNTQVRHVNIWVDGRDWEGPTDEHNSDDERLAPWTWMIQDALDAFWNAEILQIRVVIEQNYDEYLECFEYSYQPSRAWKNWKIEYEDCLRDLWQDTIRDNPDHSTVTIRLISEVFAWEGKRFSVLVVKTRWDPIWEEHRWPTGPEIDVTSLWRASSGALTNCDEKWEEVCSRFEANLVVQGSI